MLRVNSPVKPRRAPSPGKTRSGPRDGRARGRSPKGGGGGPRQGQKDSSGGGQQDPLMDDNQVMTNEEEERAHAYLSKVRRRMSRSLSPGNKRWYLKDTFLKMIVHPCLEISGIQKDFYFLGPVTLFKFQ